MTHINSEWAEHQLRRWMRPDAHRFVRPDWCRYVRPGFEQDHPFALYEQKYRPDQPRVPAGNPDGGEWTADASGRGLAAASNAVANEKRPQTVLSDATPDPIRPGARYAQYRPRTQGYGSRGGEPTPAQAAREVVTEAQARDAIRRVQELDPNWRPTPGFRETVEGNIIQYQAEAQQAQARLLELQRVGVAPGPYAGESISARGPGRGFTVGERQEINGIGYRTGCHTCGTLDPNTRSGNFVPDHQPPNALNRFQLPQRLFPQCINCSAAQGGWLSGNAKAR